MRYRYWALIAAAVVFGFSITARAAPLTVGQLMDVLAANRQGSATFTETKYIAVLDVPFKSSGELMFVAPSYLEKRTLKPWPESAVLNGNTLTMRNDKRKLVVHLEQYPQVAAMVESIRATLTGDRAALERVYDLRLDGTLANWRLLLTPRSSDVSAVVSHVELQGNNNRVHTVEIDQADGDRSVMHIGPMEPRAKVP